MPLVSAGTSFRTVVSDWVCNLTLQLGSGVTFHAAPPREGSVIDIDAFVQFPQITRDLGETFSRFLNAGHEAEKRLFFRLLSPELLASLNPVYA